MEKASRSYLLYIPSIFFIVLILYFGRIVFIPLFFGLFIAIVLYPICKYLELKNWPRSAAVGVGLFIVFLVLSLLLVLLVLQFQAFVHDLPELKTRISPSVEQLKKWLEINLGFSITSYKSDNGSSNITNNILDYVRSGISQTIDLLFMALITPVFTALFLYNRETFVRFLQLIVKNTTINLSQILEETIHTYFKFIKGMTLVYIIVGVLNSIGLLALGVEHAILFGMLTAIMTIIPYIGIIISAALPVSIAWASSGSLWLPLAVIALFSFVQYLEAYIIFPKIVGIQLNVSSWSVLTAALFGGVIWGVAGMVLFIPFVGVLKIISGYIDELQPLNILLSSNRTVNNTN